jgi:predicted Na+-dependent transporter
MDIAAIDQARLNFNPQGLFIINAAIGLMMLGVALELKLDDFKRIFVAPKAPAIGLIALGMILVAACPGGNLSNIITYLARGNCAISVSMTAVSTAAAIIMTPLNLALWGSPKYSQYTAAGEAQPVGCFCHRFHHFGNTAMCGSIAFPYVSIASPQGSPPV